MKLAEALVLRADCQKRVAELKERIIRNAKVQEGDEPAEAPGTLLEEFERVAAELVRLVRLINATNTATTLTEGWTIADAIAVRDSLRSRQHVYRDLAVAATISLDRYSKSEVKFQSTVSVAEIQKRADALGKEHRELDARIQESNWKTELRES